MGTPSEDAATATPARPQPLDVSLIAQNVPFVLRTFLGLAVLGVGINVIGVLVISVLVTAMNTTAEAHQLRVILTTAGVLTVASVAVGVALAALIQRRTLRWLLRGETPNAHDARRALRMPLDLGVITAALWTIGGAIIGVAAAAVGEDVKSVIGIVGGIVVAGFVSAGFMYLVMARFNQEVARLALAAAPPRSVPLFGVRWRLLLNWVLTSALPLIGLVLVLSAPPGKTHIVGVSIVVAVLAIAIGGLSTGLVARALGNPLRTVVEALNRVGDGDLDVRLQIDDPGEIGLVQNGFNVMVSGLEERDRVKDLFGRHVGPAVAAEAMTSGVTLSGESRDVVALFVDITGSTRLTRITEPAEFVNMLNRFFEVVVDEVEGHGGLLNKFEGDAALCIFGAPVELPDAATAALRTARAIRDRVTAMAELEVGIGVASGPVIAGQIGAASRLEYTIIGDAVNEAARLTDLAKRVDGRILVTEATVLAADPDEREEWVKGRSLRLRGRETATNSYRTASAPVAPTITSLPRRLGEVARAVTDFPAARPRLRRSSAIRKGRPGVARPYRRPVRTSRSVLLARRHGRRPDGGGLFVELGVGPPRPHLALVPRGARPRRNRDAAARRERLAGRRLRRPALVGHRRDRSADRSRPLDARPRRRRDPRPGAGCRRDGPGRHAVRGPARSRPGDRPGRLDVPRRRRLRHRTCRRAPPCWPAARSCGPGPTTPCSR